MIRIDLDNGKVEMSGSITRMLSELTSGITTLIDNMPMEDERAKNMSAHLLRAMLYQVHAKMDEYGMKHEIADKELKEFKRNEEYSRDDTKRRMVEEIMKMLFDDDDDSDDDETEDDVPDFMF